jgi:hypothetical protein
MRLFVLVSGVENANPQSLTLCGLFEFPIF